MTLAKVLKPAFGCPSDNAAGERNHKQAKGVHTKARSTLDSTKVKKRTFIAANYSQR